jgi:hypothetical protein
MLIDFEFKTCTASCTPRRAVSRSKASDEVAMSHDRCFCIRQEYIHRSVTSRPTGNPSLASVATLFVVPYAIYTSYEAAGRVIPTQPQYR